MGLDLAPEMMCKGLFYRHQDKTWYPADWWLDRLEVDEEWICLRLEYLKADLLNVFKSFEPIGLAGQRNRNQYSRNLKKWFNSNDLNKIYEMNPKWTSLEVRCYGKTLDF